MRLGRLLKETRIKRGLSLSEVSRELLIQEEYLEAIEDGIDGILPSGTYNRIYTRAYCKFLGVEFREDEVDKEKKEVEIREFSAADEFDEILDTVPEDDEEFELSFDFNRAFRIGVKLLITAFVLYMLIRLIMYIF